MEGRALAPFLALTERGGAAAPDVGWAASIPVIAPPPTVLHAADGVVDDSVVGRPAGVIIHNDC